MRVCVREVPNSHGGLELLEIKQELLDIPPRFPDSIPERCWNLLQTRKTLLGIEVGVLIAMLIV